MTNEDSTPLLGDTSILTIKHFDDIFKALDHGSIEFKENVAWKSAARMLDEYRMQGVVLPVILADSTEAQLGVLAWGIAEKIVVKGASTRVVLRDLDFVPSQPVLASFLCRSTGEYLSDVDQRNYRIVETPDFLLAEPKTFVLTWNPKKRVSMEEALESLKEFQDAGSLFGDWSCRSHKKVRAGDRFVMLRQGATPRGIVGSGWIRSNGWEGDDGGSYVNILWERMLDPEEPFDPTKIDGLKGAHWKPEGSGIELYEPARTAFWNAWEKKFEEELLSEPAEFESQNRTPNVPANINQEEDPASNCEGRLIESWSTRHERSPELRAKCLATHGYSCFVCKMDFISQYGEIGKGFVHVHHERPLAASDNINGVTTDPISDMKPVCPNCHAMLHFGLDARKGQVRTIEELRTMRELAEKQR